MTGYQFTYIFVDDGSSDATLSKLYGLAKAHPNVRYLSFSRNFGKEAAMYAGLKNSSGDLVIIMDADLQQSAGHDPRNDEGNRGGL